MLKRLMVLLGVIFWAAPLLAADISEADVNTFFNNWLVAQNTGDYNRYAAMYATRFKGIKRAGERTYLYNHDTWLKDRERMFRNKMSVSAASVRVTVFEHGAKVEFRQTWESGRYKDKGDKELYLRKENGRLRITMEEMLASKVLAGKGAVLDSANFSFAFAMPEGIVLPDQDVKIDVKKLKLTSNGVDYSASAPVEPEQLPKSIRSLLGMQVRIYGPKGACESKINGFKVVSKKIPHFGEIQRWEEEKTPRKEITVNVYNEGLGHLVATTEKCSGDFAKDARLPVSPVFMGRKPDKETAAMAAKAFRALAAYRTDIKSYVKDEYFESIKIFEFSHSGKTEKWISIYAESGYPYCGGEGGILGVLWKMEDGAKGQKLRFDQYIGSDLEYLTDIDNDGYPEFLSRDAYTRGVPQSFEFVPATNSKMKGYIFKGSYDYDCPC